MQRAGGGCPLTCGLLLRIRRDGVSRRAVVGWGRGGDRMAAPAGQPPSRALLLPVGAVREVVLEEVLLDVAGLRLAPPHPAAQGGGGPALRLLAGKDIRRPATVLHGLLLRIRRDGVSRRAVLSWGRGEEVLLDVAGLRLAPPHPAAEGGGGPACGLLLRIRRPKEAEGRPSASPLARTSGGRPLSSTRRPTSSSLAKDLW